MGFSRSKSSPGYKSRVMIRKTDIDDTHVNVSNSNHALSFTRYISYFVCVGVVDVEFWWCV